jgi:MFS family permease
MQTITVPFVVFQLTQSPGWLGLTSFLQQIPSVVCGPLGGVLAERYDRRRLVTGAQILQMTIAFSLWALFTSGHLTHLRMLPLLVIGGAVGSIYITSWQTLVPLLVPISSLAAAYRLNSLMFTSTRMIGPMIGGPVLAAFGPAGAFLANALAYFVPITTVSLSRPRAVERSPRTSPFGEFRAGLAYALQRPPIWIPILTASTVSLFGQSLTQLAAGIAAEVFRVGAMQYSMLLAMFGAGGIAMSIVTVLIGDRIRRSRVAQLGLFVYALAITSIGFSSSYSVGIFGFLVMGAAHIMVQVSVSTSMQIHVSEAFRGRVTSLYLTGIMVSVPIGSLLGGLIGEGLGLQWTTRIFGTLLLAYAGFATAGLDGLRLLDGGDTLAE